MNGRKQIVIVLLQSGIDATLHNARSTTPSFLQLIVVVGFIVFEFVFGMDMKWNGVVRQKKYMDIFFTLSYEIQFREKVVYSM